MDSLPVSVQTYMPLFEFDINSPEKLNKKLIIINVLLPLNLVKDENNKWDITFLTRNNYFPNSVFGGHFTEVIHIGGVFVKPDWTKDDIDQICAVLKKKSCIPVFTSDNSHYSGFAHTILWPLYHYLTINLDGMYSNLSKLWKSLLEATQQFCDTVLDFYKEGDIVWIHDYHLHLLPKYLRNKHSNMRIGFFFHIPFPSSEIYRMLPFRSQLLLGVLDADLIGFNSVQYVDHFLSSCQNILGIDTVYKDYHCHRSPIVTAFQIGIQPEKYEDIIKTPKCQEMIRKMKDSLKNYYIFLSIDTLTKIAGIEHKILAYEKHPFVNHQDLNDRDISLWIKSASKK